MLQEKLNIILNNAVEYMKRTTEFLRKKGNNFEFYFDTKYKTHIKYDRNTEEFAAFDDSIARSYFIKPKGEIDKSVEEGRFQKLLIDPSKF